MRKSSKNLFKKRILNYNIELIGLLTELAVEASVKAVYAEYELKDFQINVCK